jgi:phage portal protein BeeE
MTFLNRLLGRETRATAKIDDPYISEFFGLRGGVGGYVDPGRASGIAVAHACIAIVSQNLAAMPLNLYRRAENGGRERATDHPLYAVLHDMANSNMTARGGSVCLNSFGRFAKWISASIMPPPSWVPAR